MQRAEWNEQCCQSRSPAYLLWHQLVPSSPAASHATSGAFVVLTDRQRGAGHTASRAPYPWSAPTPGSPAPASSAAFIDRALFARSGSRPTSNFCDRSAHAAASWPSRAFAPTQPPSQVAASESLRRHLQKSNCASHKTLEQARFRLSALCPWHHTSHPTSRAARPTCNVSPGSPPHHIERPDDASGP